MLLWHQVAAFPQEASARSLLFGKKRVGQLGSRIRAHGITWANAVRGRVGFGAGLGLRDSADVRA